MSVCFCWEYVHLVRAQMITQENGISQRKATGSLPLPFSCISPKSIWTITVWHMRSQTTVMTFMAAVQGQISLWKFCIRVCGTTWTTNPAGRSHWNCISSIPESPKNLPPVCGVNFPLELIASEKGSALIKIVRWIKSNALSFCYAGNTLII